MAPHVPAGALGALLRVIGKPVLGSVLPARVQRVGVQAVCATLPRTRIPRRVREIAAVTVWELTPADARPSATILYFHGGGYMTGSPRDHLGLLSHLAVAARTRLLAVDYRLAPEHPFPAAHSDAVAVLTALLEDGQDPEQLTLAGDSAGGGLALAVAVAARENGRPAPGRLVLFSPWLDLRLSAAGEDRADALLSRGGVDRWAAAYCAGHSRTDPRVSPLLADLAGLPPTLVQYDVAETLAGQSVAFLAAARAAGVAVTDQPFSGLWHDFQLFTQLPQARAALSMAGAFVRGD